MKQYLQIGVLICVLIIGITLSNNAIADLSQAEANLDAALKSGSVKQSVEAAVRLAEFDNERAMRSLLIHLPKLPPDKYDLYWGVLNTLAFFNDERALTVLSDFLINSKGKPLGRDALYVLQANHSSAMVKLLGRILDKGSREQQLCALDHLSEIKSKYAVATLIEFLKQPICKRDEDLQKQVLDSLRALAGKESGQSIESAVAWWEKHRNDDESTLFEIVIPKPITGTGTAVDTLDYVRMNRFGGLKRLPKDKIIVVDGYCNGCEKSGRDPITGHQFDFIEKILEQMGIPHTVVRKSDFDSDQYRIDDKIAVLMNCNMFRKHCTGTTCKGSDQATGLRLVGCAGPGPHDPYSSQLSDSTIEKIKNYVARDGYLFTEDWILEEVLERAFKGILSHTKYYEEEKNVTILPAPGETIHPYLKGVFEKPNLEKDPSSETTTVPSKRLNVGKGKWKIDKSSPDIKILKSQEVTTLIVSPDLKTSDNPIGPVAITFGYSRSGGLIPRITGIQPLEKKVGGQVLHVLSHFGKQLDKLDEFVLQNLLLNFLLEAAERHSLKTKK